MKNDSMTKLNERATKAMDEIRTSGDPLPEGWQPIIDLFSFGIERASAREHQVAKAAFVPVVEFLSGYEGLPPGEDWPTILGEAGPQYALAMYLGTDAKDRAKALFEAVKLYQRAGSVVVFEEVGILEAMEEAHSKPLPELGAFLPEWTDLVASAAANAPPYEQTGPGDVAKPQWEAFLTEARARLEA